MQVFADEQHRLPQRQGLELVQQGLELQLALALRAEAQLGGRVRQRQQLGQQLDFGIGPRIGRQQPTQLVELPVGAVLALEAGGAFELSDERVERAVLVIWRAEIAHAGMRFPGEPVVQRAEEARLADPCFAAQQHDLTLARNRPLPAAQQQLDLLVAPDKRR